MNSQRNSSSAQLATMAPVHPTSSPEQEGTGVKSVNFQPSDSHSQATENSAARAAIDNQKIQAAEAQADAAHHEKVHRAIAVLKQEQNLLYGTMVAVGIGFLCAVVYSAIVFWTQKEFVYAILGIAVGISWAMRDVGKGRSPIFGCVGMMVFVATMMLTNLFILLGWIAREEGMGLFSVITQVHVPAILGILPQFIMEAAGPVSVLLYSVGAVLCFCGSFERISREQVIEKYKQLN